MAALEAYIQAQRPPAAQAKELTVARYISALHAVPQITHARRLCGLFTARDT